MALRFRLTVAVLICLASVDRRSVSGQHLARTSPLRATASPADVIGLEGHSASLPCDIVPPTGDTTLIVLWYRDGSDAPVYSYDFRNREESARRWHNASVFGSRAEFVPGRRPAVLTLRDLAPADQSLYKCRVDFQHSRTRNALVNLTVVTAPEYVRIVSPRGRILETVAGTFSEGDRLELTCRVKGGSPRPVVRWRSAGRDLPAVSQPQGTEYTVSRYTAEALGRDDLHRMITCLASNTNLSAPATSSVMIDMNFAPLSVSLLGKGEPLSAGRRYPLVCQCVGSRPPAAITWFLGSARMATAPGTTIHQGNITMSTLELTPRPADDGKILTCRCDNPALASAPTLEDSWEIAVHYAPIVSLTLGSSLDRSRIKEGDDVYFECSINANPPVYKTEWRHNNRVLLHSVRDNIIISNYSLVLQEVRPFSSGVYLCVGSNSEGSTDSNPVFLDVKFPPICRPGLQHIHGVSKREEADVLCDVTANPAERIHFLWTFNNTSEWRELDNRLVNSSETRSTLRYRPRTEMDYGTVFCWATNDIGRMARPCVFHIIAAGPPDPLFNCTLSKRTGSSVTVRCLEAFDGGLVQRFLLAVLSYDDTVIYNKTSSQPEWHVTGLIPTQRYRIQAVSLNDKGMSASVTIPLNPVSGPETQVEKVQDFTLAEMQPGPAARAPMLAVVLGGLGSMALLLLVAAGVTVSRRRGRHQRSLLAPRSSASSAAGAADTDRGPDIVPDPNGSTQQEVYRIPPDIPELPAGARAPASAIQRARPTTDLPLRVFLPHPHPHPHHHHHHHHHHQATGPAAPGHPVTSYCSATLPAPHGRVPPPWWTQSTCSTLSRRRGPPGQLETGRPPDAAHSHLIGPRCKQSGVVIGYSTEPGALIGCGPNESAL